MSHKTPLPQSTSGAQVEKAEEKAAAAAAAKKKEEASGNKKKREASVEAKDRTSNFIIIEFIVLL